jgi:hypothetical protein
MFAPRPSALVRRAAVTVLALGLGALVACSSGGSKDSAGVATTKTTTEPTVLGEVLTSNPNATPAAPVDITTTSETTAAPVATTTTRRTTTTTRRTTTTTRPATTTTAAPTTTTTTALNTVTGSYDSFCDTCTVTVELYLGDGTTLVGTQVLTTGPNPRSFTFDGLVDGSYEVHVTDEDSTGAQFISATDPFELSGGETHHVDCSWNGACG